MGSGIGPTDISSVIGVFKAYSTRVGSGPMPTELHDDMGDFIREKAGEYGATTGRPRRCGWFDTVVARYASRVNGFTHLAITKLDVLDTFEKIPLCVGYRCGGERRDEFPAEADAVDRVEPIYEELDGWCEPTSDVREFADLPHNARTYVRRLEELMDVPLAFVSVGTRRDQLVSVE